MNQKDLELLATMKALSAEHNAGRHLALYYKTGNGLLIWKAYQEYRKLELPVPEEILRLFDRIGARLLEADTPTNVVDALQLFNRTGGPQRNTLLAGQEHQRDMVERFRDLREVNASRPESERRPIRELAQRVADEFGVSRAQVQQRYSDWKKSR